MAPRIPYPLQIRRIIFERYNDASVPFNSDEILDIIRGGDDAGVEPTAGDLEPFFREICRSGMMRDIAQNLETIWFKLFDIIDEVHCTSCSMDVHLAKSEERMCPNPDCAARL